jgi:hypothetical protein
MVGGQAGPEPLPASSSMMAVQIQSIRTGEWRRGTVLDTEPGGAVKVRYDGFAPRWDEWLARDDARLRWLQGRLPPCNSTPAATTPILKRAPARGPSICCGSPRGRGDGVKGRKPEAGSPGPRPRLPHRAAAANQLATVAAETEAARVAEKQRLAMQRAAVEAEAAAEAVAGARAARVAEEQRLVAERAAAAAAAEAETARVAEEQRLVAERAAAAAAAAAEAETARVAEEERLVAEEHQMSFTGNAKQDKPRMTIQDCHTIATFQRIIAEKVVEFVRSQGHRVMHAHVLKYLGVLGVNKMCAALENKYKVSPVQMVSEAFAAFDLNHDGQISKSELESVLCSVRFGRHVGAKAVGSLMSKLDVDMDGLISLDEFKTYALAAPYKAKSGESAKCSTRWAIQRQHR